MNKHLPFHVSLFSNMRTKRPWQHKEHKWKGFNADVILNGIYMKKGILDSDDVVNSRYMKVSVPDDNLYFDDYQKIKETSLCMSPHARFQNGRQMKGDNFIELSRLFFFDIDIRKNHDDPISPTNRMDFIEQIMSFLLNSSEAKEIRDYIFFMRPSTSINGLHIFMKYSERVLDDIQHRRTIEDIKKKFKEYYMVFFNRLKKIVDSRFHSLEYDPAGQTINKLCTITYTDHVHYNTASKEIDTLIKSERNVEIRHNSHNLTRLASFTRGKTFQDITGYSDLYNFLAAHYPAERFAKEKVGNSNEVVIKCVLGTHTDSTPSFCINRRKNVWCCHGCGQKGNWYEFLKFHCKAVDFKGVKEYFS